MTASSKKTGYLSIRQVPPALKARLEKLRKDRGSRSLNQLVIDILMAATGLSKQAGQDNGLKKYAGTWAKADLDEFSETQKSFSKVEDDIWK